LGNWTWDIFGRDNMKLTHTFSTFSLHTNTIYERERISRMNYDTNFKIPHITHHIVSRTIPMIMRISHEYSHDAPAIPTCYYDKIARRRLDLMIMKI